MFDFFTHAKTILQRNWLFSLVFILEIVFCFLLLTISYNRYAEERTYLSKLDSPEMEKSIAFYYSPSRYGLNGDRPNEMDIRTFLDDHFKENASYVGAERVERLPLINPAMPEAPFQLITYSPKLMKVMAPKLTEGRLPASQESQVTEAIWIRNRKSAAQYKVGDVITVESDQENSLQAATEPESKPLRIEVVGLVEEKDAIFLSDGSSWVSGPGMNANDIFPSKETFADTFFAPTNPKLASSGTFSMILFDANTPEETMKSYRDELLNYGSAYLTSELKKESYDTLSVRLQRDKPLNLLGAFILISGMVGLAVLNAQKNKTTFELYHILGASYKDCLTYLAFSYGLLLVVGWFILKIVLVVLSKLDQRGSFIYYHLDGPLPLGFLLVSLLAVAMMLLPTYILFRKGEGERQ